MHKILVVDDERFLREDISDVLALEGFEVFIGTFEPSHCSPGQQPSPARVTKRLKRRRESTRL